MSAAPRVSPTKTVPWSKILAALVLLAAIVWAYHFVDLAAVRRFTEKLNPWLVFAALTLLPLAGFPVTLLQIAVGVRFGTAVGILLVAASIILQLLASYALVAQWHRYFARKLDPVRARIPRAAYSDVCWFTMVLPGVPYFAKNYVLPLLGVPMRTFLLICFPVHLLRSIVSVVLGDESDHLTPGRVTFLVVYYAITLVAAGWFFRQLRAKFFRNHPGPPPAREHA